MAISFPVSLPAISGVEGVTFAPNSTVSVSRSPFSGVETSHEWPAQWWQVDVNLPVMLRPEFAPWQAGLTSLRGRKGTFLFGDPRGQVLRGAGGGFDLGVGGAGLAAGDVVADGGVEQERLLDDHRGAAAVGVDIESSEVFAVDQNLTGTWFVKSN